MATDTICVDCGRSSHPGPCYHMRGEKALRGLADTLDKTGSAVDAAAAANVRHTFKPKVVGSSTEPVPEIIGMLEELLVRARKGEMSALAWAAVFSNGTLPDGSIDSNFFASKFTGWALSAALNDKLLPEWRQTAKERMREP